MFIGETIDDDFNPETFINAHKFKNNNELIEYIKKVDTDDELYNSFLNKLSDTYNVILELKYNMDNEDDSSYITEVFPFRLTKNSKYVVGIEKMYVQ